jgi:hypothetical protein
VVPLFEGRRRRQDGRGRIIPAASPYRLGDPAIRRLSRAEIENLVEILITRLDELDPDPDLEPSADERNGSGAEDDFALLVHPGRLWGPGREISDPC